MMSYRAIIHYNKQLHRQLAGTPLLPYDGTKAYWLDLPHVGWGNRKGFSQTAKYFVDSSGFGADHEPALSQAQFMQHVTIGRYYGIAEAGEFQVYIREFKRIGEE